MRTLRATFPGHDGAELSARLDLPEFGARAYALFAHCFTCGKDIAAARRVAQRLAGSGIGVLRFDFTGLGHSQGEFAHTSFCSNVEDLLAAADYLRREHGAPQLIIGHSLGGAAAILAAARIPEATAVAVLGAPADPGHVLEHLGSSVEAIRRDGEAEVTLAGRNFRIGRAFVEAAETASITEALAHLKRALLVLHAPRDEVVGVDNATRIFVAAKHPKSFVSLDDADHLISREEDAGYAADVIASWAARYVTLAPEEHPGDAGEEVARSAELDPKGFLQDVHAGGHHLFADEPAAVGGTDRGPSPYQLVAAGLAACTSMTVRMYARRKGVALERVVTDVTHAKIHAEDCADCETEKGKIDEFRRVVRLEGDLTEAERAKLLEIADKCPVHRTLHGEIKVRTALG